MKKLYKHIVLMTLGILSINLMNAQTNAEWQYWDGFSVEGGGNDLLTLSAGKDTTIMGQVCVPVSPDRLVITGSQVSYIYSENDKVYRLHYGGSEFLLLYDYTLTAGDEYSTEFAHVTVDSVVTVFFNEKETKRFFVTIETSRLGGELSNHVITEGIGDHQYYFADIPLPESAPLDGSYHPEMLVSYSDNEIAIDSLNTTSSIINVRNVVGLSNSLNRGHHFVLQSNPVKDVLKLTSVKGDYNLSIRDVSGKKVSNRKIFSASDGELVSINVSSLSEGMYILSINTDEAKQVISFVKE